MTALLVRYIAFIRFRYSPSTLCQVEDFLLSSILSLIRRLTKLLWIRIKLNGKSFAPKVFQICVMFSKHAKELRAQMVK